MKSISLHRQIVVAASALLTFSALIHAAPADLDTSFDGTGKVTTDVGGQVIFDQIVAVQFDGKIIAAGTAKPDGGSVDQFFLVRYNADGGLDPTFGTGGKVFTDFGGGGAYLNGLVLQLDGRMVAVGYTYIGGVNHVAVARYNANGSLDATFNGTGKVVTTVPAGLPVGENVAGLPDGKVVVTGQVDVAGINDVLVVRYNPDGSLDTTFNGTGIVTVSIGPSHDYGRAVLPVGGGKLIIAGYSGSGVTDDFAAIRLNADGTLDTSFGGTGKVTTPIGAGQDVALDAVLQPDGKLILAGFTAVSGGSDYALVRYNGDGSLDTSFNGTGKVVTSFALHDSTRGVSLQPDGKIVAAGGATDGGSSQFAVARYNTNGTLDTSFNGTGKLTTAVGTGGADGSSVAVGYDGKIIVAGKAVVSGESNLAVVRYVGGPLQDTDGDGIPDAYENGGGVFASPTQTGTSAALADSDGDGLQDGAEIFTYHTNPNLPDTDGDGFNDGVEVSSGFDPTNPASVPEVVATILPAVEYRFSSQQGVSYRIEVSTDLVNWTTLESPIFGTGGIISRLFSVEGLPKRFFRTRKN
jgi:uncharacterized delta-60 repeat protein